MIGWGWAFGLQILNRADDDRLLDALGVGFVRTMYFKIRLPGWEPDFYFFASAAALITISRNFCPAVPSSKPMKALALSPAPVNSPLT